MTIFGNLLSDIPKYGQDSWKHVIAHLFELAFCQKEYFYTHGYFQCKQSEMSWRRSDLFGGTGDQRCMYDLN